MNNNATGYEVNAADTYRTMNPFSEARRMFANYIGYTGPMSFEEWMKVDSDKKAAVLFVQFFDQITLAWYKTKSFYTAEEDGVSTMMQYLIKNVPIIEEHPERFRPGYIYQVAYNCLYCICHDLKKDRERFELEVSNVCMVGDDEVDLFDTVCDADLIDTLMLKDSFWAAIEELDLSSDMMEFVYSLASSNKPVRMSKEKQAVVDKLKIVLAPFLDTVLRG